MKLPSIVPALALSIGFCAVGAPPCHAQETSAAPPAVKADAAVVIDQRAPAYQSKGPIRFDVGGFTLKGQRRTLALVPRAMVAGANAGAIVGGIASVLLHAPTTINGASKEYFYGIEISDAKNTSILVNPLIDDIPAAVDQAITASLAADPTMGAMQYKEALYFYAGPWILVYDELMSDNDNYYVLFKASVGKTEEGQKQTMAHNALAHGGSCNYKSEPKPLSAWRANDYAAVALERKKATDSCVQSVLAQLPQILGMDADSKIRSAKQSCKTGYAECMAASDKTADPGEHKKTCKVEQKQCVSDDVKSLVDMTPLGQCKVVLLECRAGVTDNFHATTPDGKPDKAAFQGCTADYKKCAEANKKERSFLGIF